MASVGTLFAGGRAIFSKPMFGFSAGFAPFDWSIHRERFFIFFVSIFPAPVVIPYRRGIGGVIFFCGEYPNIFDRILC